MSMKYVILATHPPDICPTSNKKMKELMMKAAPQIPNVAKKHGVTFLAGPLVNWEHTVTIVAEASKMEQVWDFIYESGMQQWNSVRVIPSVPIEEGLGLVEKSNSIF